MLFLFQHLYLWNKNKIIESARKLIGRKIKEEVPTKTIATTTNQVIRGESGGKKEITKKVTNESN